MPMQVPGMDGLMQLPGGNGHSTTAWAEGSMSPGGSGAGTRGAHSLYYTCVSHT